MPFCESALLGAHKLTQGMAALLELVGRTLTIGEQHLSRTKCVNRCIFESFISHGYVVYTNDREQTHHVCMYVKSTSHIQHLF